jgi:hypothetical protein
MAPETAKFKGQFFADPTRTLYHALGMNVETLERTPKGQKRPSYLSFGPMGGLMQSLWVNISDSLLSVVIVNTNTIIERSHKEPQSHW